MGKDRRNRKKGSGSRNDHDRAAAVVAVPDGTRLYLHDADAVGLHVGVPHPDGMLYSALLELERQQLSDALRLPCEVVGDRDKGGGVRLRVTLPTGAGGCRRQLDVPVVLPDLPGRGLSILPCDAQHELRVMRPAAAAKEVGDRSKLAIYMILGPMRRACERLFRSQADKVIVRSFASMLRGTCWWGAAMEASELVGNTRCAEQAMHNALAVTLAAQQLQRCIVMLHIQ